MSARGLIGFYQRINKIKLKSGEVIPPKKVRLLISLTMEHNHNRGVCSTVTEQVCLHLRGELCVFVVLFRSCYYSTIDVYVYKVVIIGNS